MSTFKVGDKVIRTEVGREAEIQAGPWVADGGDHVWKVGGFLEREADLAHAPAAPPKLGKVRVVIYPNGEAGAWSEQESAYAASARALTPGELKFDRILDLDALDADAKEANEWKKAAASMAEKAAKAERRAESLALRCDNYHKRMLAAEKRCGELELAESSRFRAAPADLVSLDELWEKHRVVVRRMQLPDGSSVWSHTFDNGVVFTTHAAAWKAASEWAKQ